MAEDIEVIARLAAVDEGMVDAFDSASKAAAQLQQQTGQVNKGLIAVGAAIGAASFALYKFGKGSFDAAARVSELDVAISAIGKSSGVGADAIRDTAKAIASQGIKMAAAQQMAIEYAQGNLDMAQASKVARVAQDLAVISQRDSTDTAQLLTRAIKTGNSMLLKSAGVSRMASEGYATYARQLGKNTTQLTATERQQALINLIMDEGAKVAGVYEAAMQEPGKVLRSFPRLLNDMQVAFGGALLKGFGPLIKAAYDLTSAFSKAVKSGGPLYPFITELGNAMKALFTPFKEMLVDLTNLIKRFKEMGISAQGASDQIKRFAPIILTAATALSTLAGKGILKLIPGLSGLANFLNPVTAGLAVMVALNPKLREGLMRIAKALAPLIPAFIAIGKAVAEASQIVVENLASIVDVLAGPLAGVISVVAKMFEYMAYALSLVSPILQPLIILFGVKYVGSLLAVQVATIRAAFASGQLTAQTSLLGKVVAATSKIYTNYMFSLRQTGKIMPALRAASVATFTAIKASIMSVMASLGPMILVTLAIMAVMKLFQAFSDRNKQLEERTKALTEAANSQVKSFKDNRQALGAYLQSAKMTGDTIASTAEDGEKLSLSLNKVGKSGYDTVQVLQSFQKSAYDAAYSLAVANGASAEIAERIANNVSIYEDASSVTNGLTGKYADLAVALEELNDQAEKTDLQAFIQSQLDAVSALGKEEAALVASTKATVEADYAKRADTNTTQMYLDIQIAVGKAIGALQKAQEKQKIATDKAKLATVSMIQRLDELKAANDDGKFSAEEMARALYGIEAFDANKLAKSIFDMRKNMTDLLDTVKASKGNFDGLTGAGFQLVDMIAQNASTMKEMGKSGSEIAAMQSVLIQRFMDGAKAAGFTDDAVRKLLDSLGIMSQLRTKVVIDADIAGFKAKMDAVTKALEALSSSTKDNQLRKEYSDMLAGYKAALAALGKESAALESYNKQLTRVQENSKGAAKESKEVTAQKKKLREAILKLVNDALEKETKKLEELKGKLEALKSATEDAIMGGYDFGNAWSAAAEEAQKVNDELQALRDQMTQFRDGVTDAVAGSFTMADALGAQKQAAEDLARANEDLVVAQTEVAQANAIVEAASAKYLSARGRKARREAFEELQKAALDLVPAQQKLADATAKATEAQSKQITFLERLQQQADRAKGFAAKLQKLVSLGLSERGLQEIVSAGADTGGAMADELIAGGSAAVKKTNDLFAEIGDVAKKTGVELADNFYKIGSDVGADFVAALAKQADNAQKFATKVKQLVAAGFAPEAIQQVLNAGVEAGTQIADALLAGGETTLNESKRLYDSLRQTADSLKNLLGESFYQVGIDLAQKIVDGLKAKLDELEDILPDATIPQLEKILKGMPKDISDIITQPTGTPYTPITEAATQLATVSGTTGFTSAIRNAMLSDLPMFGNGGIVTKPTLGIIGEKGPEAVVPLNAMGGQGTVINLTVNAGMGADGKNISDTIVNELIKYQRRNGKIPVVTL